MTTGVAMGFGGWIGFELNNTTSIVPQFIVAVSIAVVVHLLVVFYHYLNHGYSKKEALEYSLD